MPHVSRLKSIGYFKADAGKTGAPMSKIKHTRAMIVVPDFTLSQEVHETLAFLKILELSERNIEEGKTVPLSVAMRRLRARLRKLRKQR